MTELLPIFETETLLAMKGDAQRVSGQPANSDHVRAQCNELIEQIEIEMKTRGY